MTIEEAVNGIKYVSRVMPTCEARTMLDTVADGLKTMRRDALVKKADDQAPLAIVRRETPEKWTLEDAQGLKEWFESPVFKKARRFADDAISDVVLGVTDSTPMCDLRGFVRGWLSLTRYYERLASFAKDDGLGPDPERRDDMARNDAGYVEATGGRDVIQ